MKQPAIFLDRDGVINRAIVREGKPYPPCSLVDLEILPGVADALKAFKISGYLLIVVTNQPDVARGTKTRKEVDQLNSWLQSNLCLDAIYTCYHDSSDQCNCRKPKPGLLLKAAQQYSVDLSASSMVGDRWRDIEAGKHVGCKTFFIDYGYDERKPDNFDYRIKSLTEAATILLTDGDKT